MVIIAAAALPQPEAATQAQFVVSLLLPIVLVGGAVALDRVGGKRVTNMLVRPGRTAALLAGLNTLLAFLAARLTAAYWPLPIGSRPDYGTIDFGLFSGGMACLLLAIYLQIELAREKSRSDKAETDTSGQLDEAREETTQLKLQLKEEERAREFYRLVNQYYLTVVSLKRDRVRKVTKQILRLDAAHAAKPPHEQVKDIVYPWFNAVKPDGQVAKLITATHDLFRALINLEDAEAQLRIAYFRNVKSRLELHACWDVHESDCCVSSAPSSRFKLGGDAKCLAAAAAMKGQILVSEGADADTLNKDHSFEHFNGSQRDRIKSMVAIPCGELNGTAVDHVICIDCNRPGFFNNSEVSRRKYEVIRRNIESRLLYEADTFDIIKAARLKIDALGGAQP